MDGLRRKHPKLSRHKHGRYGYITYQGRKIRIPGKWPDEQKEIVPPEVEANYWVIVGQILAKVEKVAAPLLSRELTVAGMVADYGEWLFPRVARNEYTNKRRAWAILVEHAGLVPVKDFGSAHLYSIQDSLVAQTKLDESERIIPRYSRQGINKLIGLMRGIFYWGLERIPDFPSGVCERLRRVRPLPKFAPGTRENPKTFAVPESVIQQTIPKLHEPIRSMVQLQRLCGLRPREVCRLCLGDLDRSDKQCWWYRPRSHKKAWREKDRSIPIVPAAQALIREFLSADPSAPVFSTVDRHGKKTGRFYRADAYTRAIARVCEANKIPHWSPNQLRKASAQALVENLSRQHAAALLGHDNPIVTSKFYLGQEMELAKEGAEKIAQIVGTVGKAQEKRKSGKTR